ncbi:N-acetyltransferase family protein [Aciduricibacillus chroicocephali]|uniref:N-acetyltransferase family protein n=1 Tax=Aciduricibacillus chroicocephali TaxID=3054939 RepID=A0ABY9KZ38_9BACI|nr:N-acetyltransferase family protein [Bacillaceae bacterium 44XB]
MIRNAVEQDLSEILTIYNDAILNTTAVYHYDEKTIEERKSWFAGKMANQEPVLVYEELGKVFGFATYGTFRPWPAFKYAIEHSIYVSSTGKGKGIGSQLLKELIDIASERGIKTMVAGIDTSNPASIALHEKFGFTHSGTIQNAGYKFGRWLDLAFYQLDFPGPKNPVEG